MSTETKPAVKNSVPNDITVIEAKEYCKHIYFGVVLNFAPKFMSRTKITTYHLMFLICVRTQYENKNIFKHFNITP